MTRPASALGRGLASLIPDTAFTDDDVETTKRPEIRLVPVEEIRRNPEQPREVFDSADLTTLAESIKKHGVLAPLVARRDGGRYVLIAGERRLRAASLAGLAEVPVVLKEADEGADQLEIALVENLQRADLDPVEAAKGYQRLVEHYGYTQDEVADRVGKERSTVANALRLLKLPDVVLTALRDGRISAGHAKALLPVDDAEELRRLVAKIIAQGLSVRATEQAVRAIVRTDPIRRSAAQRREQKTLDYANKVLSEALHTAVEIVPRKKGGGRIVIDYVDAEDLERLISKLRTKS
jgi:ParB family chromosome partitioning protein